MRMLDNTMSNMLCCFGFHGREDSQRSTALRKVPVHRDSPLSMLVPPSSVPYALDSPDALHQIFASNSSMRGYNAVSGPTSKRPNVQGSLDYTFRFGSESPTKKPHGRLEHLTNNVKQKLSESRLSHQSHHSGTKELRTTPIRLTVTSYGPEVEETTQVLGQSHKSIGLSELLASRAGSDIGYDSDARSIQTPSILSAAGTFKIGPRFIRKSLATIEGSQADDIPPDVNHNTTALVLGTPSNHKPVARSSPLPETPKKISFSEALQAETNESPADVLRRLSIGIGNGTIKMPDTPELRAMRMPSISRVNTEWQLSLPAPRRVSSLVVRQNDIAQEHSLPALDRKLQRLVDRVKIARRESTASTGAGSLISELDPTLVSYIENYAPDFAGEEHLEETAPTTAVKVCPKEIDEVPTDTNSTLPLSKPTNIATSKANPGSSSSAASIHLFDMRISQRLASTSQIPVLSSTSSSQNTSSKSVAIMPDMNAIRESRTSSMGRVPTFIALEHNRRPSDPETRKIFEGQTSNPVHRKGKRSMSDGSIQADHIADRGHLHHRDDSSSYYGSAIDGTVDDHKTLSPPTAGVALKNAHSFAVGGRSASGPIIGMRFAGSSTQPSTADTCLSRGGPRESIMKPKDLEDTLRGPTVKTARTNKFIKIDSTPTPVGRRFDRSTETNEKMSVIDPTDYLNVQRMRRNSTSTQALEDRRNENFSEIDPNMNDADMPPQNNTSTVSEAWLSQGRRSGWGFDFAENTPKRAQARSRISSFAGSENQNHCLGKQDNTSQIWHKAFKRLAEPTDYGRLLATPQFDREGRRKLSIKSVSDQGTPTRKPSVSSTIPRRSQSADQARSEARDELEVQAKRRKSGPILSIEPKVVVKKPHVLVKRQIRKNSSAELRRKVRTAKSLTEVFRPSTLRDTLGIWGSFPSHSREQRNGSAGPVDGVKVKDFYTEGSSTPSIHLSTPASKANSSPGLRARKSWGMLMHGKPRFNHQNTKSMTFAVPSTERAKYQRKSLVGRMRRLYRTKSSELHGLAMAQGHRSSVSAGLSVEYPELEQIPSDALFEDERHPHTTSESNMDGVAEKIDNAELDTISEVTSKECRSIHSQGIPWTKYGAEEWAKLYQDCVPSFSALRSEENVEEDGEGRRVLSLTSALRDSTINFEAELRKDTDKVKERLLQRLQSSEEIEGNLRMPGSFA